MWRRGGCDQELTPGGGVQGDAAGLALNVDVNQLENEMLLGKIKDMELTAIAKPSSNFQARKGGESLPKVRGQKP